MLARCLQRRHNIKTTLCKCFVLAGYRPTVMPTWQLNDVKPISGQCWLTVCYAGPVFTRRLFNVSCFVSFIKSHALVAAASQAVGQRYRCWASINPTLVQCFVLAVLRGGGPRVVVSTAAFHARVRGSVPGLGGLKET